MLFNIYLITVLISLGINFSNFAHVFWKLKKYGYKFEKVFIGDSNKGISFGIILGMGMVTFATILSLIPIANAVVNIATLNKWNYSVNHLITFLQNNDAVYNKYSCFIDEIERNKSLFQIKKILHKNSDIASQGMVESMYLDGASKTKIKVELIKSKKARLEYLKEISKELKVYKLSLDNIQLTMQIMNVDGKLEVGNTKIKIK
ncbi:MAG: hypothetical protein HFI86_06010 [Bacilli bacterium]|nr:hypothetical protein [Bacilli bacterium]